MREVLDTTRRFINAFIVLYIPMHILMFWVQDMAIAWKG